MNLLLLSSKYIETNQNLSAHMPLIKNSEIDSMNKINVCSGYKIRSSNYNESFLIRI
jgi:hypothetical protein